MSTTKAAATPSAAPQTRASSAAPASAARVGLAQQLGNQNLQLLLGARLLQAKLTVSHPQDVYEQEADRVADQVMRMPDRAPDVGTHAAPAVQRSAEAAADTPTVDAGMENSIASLSGRGRGLPESARSFMESRFNADFSAVRVHTDAHAHELARTVNAQAFTVGRNVVFGAGRYAPETESGKRLLAHELTHVVQQGSASQRSQANSISRATTPVLARAFDDPFKGPVNAVDEWVNGPVDVSALSPTQLQGQIDELEQFRDRQTTSSAKLTRIQEALVLLRNELKRQNLPARPARGRGKRANAKANAASRPARSPRILTARTSVIYTNPAELRAEYDLIVRWLAVKDLPASDKIILRMERDSLAPQVAMDRERVIAERHAARARAALTPSDKSNAGAALVSLAQTIDGISRTPDENGAFYIYHQRERIAISGEQAAGLRKEMASELEHAAWRIMGKATLELDRYHKTVERNEDDWLEARAAELMKGRLRGFDDPLRAMQARFPRIGQGVRAIRLHLKAGRLADAAAIVPEIEILGKEMAKVSRAFENNYIEGAERAVTVLEYTVKAAAAIELSLIAAAAAPFVAGHVAGFVGAEGLGLTGLAGTAVTTVGTAAGTGVIVGGGNALARGGVAFGSSLAKGHSFSAALDASTGEAVQGFYDGFLAGATGGAGRALAPALGVGANLSYQAARRAGAEAIANGTATMVAALARGKSLKEAIAEGTQAALLAVPAALVGGGPNDVKRLIIGAIAASGAAYTGAVIQGASTSQALEQASFALASHVAVSTAKHPTGVEAAAVKRGQQAGKAVKRTVINTAAAIAISNANAPPLPSPGRQRVALIDHAASSARVAGGPTPTPTPGNGAPQQRMPSPFAVNSDTSGSRTRAELSSHAPSGVTAPATAPRYILPSLPVPEPGSQPKLLPPHLKVGGFVGKTEGVLPDPRLTTVAGFARDIEASVPLADVPDVPPPDRTVRVGGPGRESEPPVPHNPNAPPRPPSPAVSGFARDPQRMQWGSEVPELLAEKYRVVGGFARKGKPAVPFDPTEPQILRDPKENQFAFVDGFGRGRGAPAPSDPLEARTPPGDEDWSISFDRDPATGTVRMTPGEPSSTPDEPNLSAGPGGSPKEPFKISERELQHLAAEALRRPVEDFNGKVHFYRTRGEFEAEYVRRWPKKIPPTGGYFDPTTKEIHISPDADVPTAIHETAHKVRDRENKWGRQYVGAFLDEGVAEGIVRARGGRHASATGYLKNVAFYWLLKRTLGSDVVDIALLHGEYRALHEKVRQLFGGSEARTLEFFGKLRSIGAQAENQKALDEAVAMLETAGGKHAWQLAGTAAPPSPAASSLRARIETLGAFSFLGVRTMNGKLLSRRIGALLRSGGPIARTDIGPFLEQLVADAKIAGATRLRIYPEFIENADLGHLEILAKALGGSLRKRDSVVMMDLPVSSGTTPASTAPVGAGGTPAPKVRTSVNEPQESTTDEKGDVPDAAPAATRDTQKIATVPGGAVPPSPWSPESLYHELERGIDSTLPPALPPDTATATPPGLAPEGDFARGLTGPLDAYRGPYTNALAQSAGREVAMWHDESSGEYAVTMGDRESSAMPKGSSPGNWYTPVHFHHISDLDNALTFRLPSPPDVKKLYGYWRLSEHFRNNTGLRAFIEFDIPGGGRGRTEYGIDPSNADRKIYVRIHKPGEAPETLPPFADPDDYKTYWLRRTVFNGSPPKHERTPLPLFKHLEEGFDRKAPRASAAGELAHSPASGTFERGLQTSLGAYRVFNAACRVSAGREVTIWYSDKGGEYAVTIGDAKSIPVEFTKGDWYAIVKHVPTPTGGDVVVAPMPTVPEFQRLLARFPRAVRQGRRVHAFLAFDVPGGGRGSIEFGIDSILNPDEPLYVRVHGPGGSMKPRTFSDLSDFVKRRNQ